MFNRFIVFVVFTIASISNIAQSQYNDAIFFPNDIRNQIPRRPVHPTVLNRLHINERPKHSCNSCTQFSATNNYDFVTEFSWNLFKGSKKQNPLGNLILSPLLIELLLTQLQSAASGQTQAQIAQLLRNGNPQAITQLMNQLRLTENRNELSLASAIFVTNDLKLNDSFAAESRARDVSLVPVNFSNAAEAGYIVNNWISNATKNQIRNLFKPENLQGLRLLLTNTMYFRGFWKYMFNETVPDKFQTTDKLQRTVPFMKQTSKLRANEMTLKSGVNGAWVEIPYAGNDFSMLIILPTVRHSLDRFIAAMTSDDLTDVVKQLSEPYKRTVHLKLPKFSAESSFSVVNVLLKLGLVDIFTTNSQLPYLTTNHELLKVDDILQQAVLHVDEVGTIASVATSLTVVTLSIDIPLQEFVFNVDQPFLSIIVDKRKNIPLFVSKIYNP